MKVLYVYGHVLSKDANGNYYHPYADFFLKRYSFFGEPIKCCVCEDKEGVNIMNGSCISTPCDFYFVHKINSISSVILYSNSNKKTLNHLIKNVDLVITKIPSILGYQAIKAANENNTPVLTEVMACAWDTMWNHSLRGKIVAPFMYFLCKHFARKSNFLVYVTKYHLQKKYPSNGASIHCSNVEILDIPAQTRVFDNTKNILNISTMAAVDVKFKGQEYVISVLKALNSQTNIQYHYHIAGGGNPSRLLRIARKHNVEKYVHYHGRLSQIEVLNLLDKTDIYIQPSKAEGLPRALIEAMSRGCACIGTNAGGIPELLKSKYIYRPTDTSRLLEIVKSMTFYEIQKEGEYNKNFVYNNYSKKILDSRRENFYTKIKNIIKSEL